VLHNPSLATINKEMLISQMMKAEGPWDLDRARHSQQP